MKVILEKQLQILSDCGIKLAPGIFKLDGVETRWEAEVDNDWVDHRVFGVKETRLDFQWLSQSQEAPDDDF